MISWYFRRFRPVRKARPLGYIPRLEACESRVVPAINFAASPPFNNTIPSPNGLSWFIASGDINGDGKQDFISHGGFGNDKVAAYIGNGAGGFTNTVTLDLSGLAIMQTDSVVLADLTSPIGGAPDGFDDLAYINRNFQSIDIFAADGAGSFTPVIFPPTTFQRISMAAGDLNSDGKQDLVLGRFGGGGPGGTAGEYEVLLNNGDATFTALPRTATNNLDWIAAQPTLVDINMDGFTDLVANNLFPVGGFGRGGVYYGNNDGTFVGGSVLKTPDNANVDDHVVGDFDGNGLPDVALVSGNKFYVYYQTSKGVFPTAPTTTFTTDSAPTDLVAADFDFDGFADIAITPFNATDPTVRFYVGSASQTFTGGPGVAVATAGTNTPIAIIDGDFNGTPDLIIGTHITSPASDKFQYLDNVNIPSGPINSKVSVTAAPNPITFGNSITFTARVAQFGNVPTGTVTFKVDGATVGTATLDAAGKATLITAGAPLFTVGSHNYFVSYSGDAQYVAKDSATASFSVNRLASAVGVTFIAIVPPSPPMFPNALSIYGANVTIDATIAVVGGFTPTGTFTFFADSQNLGTVSVSPTGAAQLISPIINVGDGRTISAVYNNDPIYTLNSVAIATDLLDVITLPTELDVVTSDNPSVFGEPITYTVQIRPDPVFAPFVNPNFTGVPVVILDNDNVIASLFFDAAGFASYTVPPDYPLGNHGIQAVFPGTTNLDKSNSTLFIQVVNKANSQTVLTSNPPATIVFGNSVTLNAETSIVAPGVGFPSGTITFFRDGSPIATLPTDSNGKASFVVSGLNAGPYTFTASFSGNSNVATSVSAGLPITVTPTTSVISFDADPANSSLGTPIVLTALIANGQGVPVDVGTITFSGTFNTGSGAGDQPLTDFVPPASLVVPVSGGFATTILNGLPFGTGHLFANFTGGEPNISDSMAGPVDITVSKAVPSVDLTTTVGSSLPVGTDVPFSVSLLPPGNVPFPITGTVTFLDNSVPFDTVTIAAGAAASHRVLTRGAHTITAEYNGDTNYTTASGGPLNFTIFRPDDRFSAGAGAGGPDRVNVYDSSGSKVFSPLFAFTPDHTAGVRVATADFDGDGVQDVAMGTGPGTGSRVRILSGVNGAPIADFSPFGFEFTGGVFVAAGDVNGDLRADLVVTPDKKGGARVRLYDGVSFHTLADFFGIVDNQGVPDTNFRGGARAAIGDLNHDTFGDIVVAAGSGGGPRIAAFSGKTLTLTGGPKLGGDFLAFEPNLRNGTFVAAGDINGDGFADIVAGAGPGGGPRVSVFDGAAFTAGSTVKTADFFSGDTSSRGGVPVAFRFLNDDDISDLVTGNGGGGDTISAYRGELVSGAFTEPAPFLRFDAFAQNPDPTDATRGVFVG